MTKFYYKAYNNEAKQEVSGEIEANSPREARDKVRELGLLPTFVKEKVIVHVPEKISQQTLVKDLKFEDKMHFVSELQVMLSSGIAVIEALDVVVNNSKFAKISKLAKDIQVRIKNGATFYQAMLPYSNIFGDVFMGLCNAGEQSGKLDKTLLRAVDILKKEDKLRSKVIKMSVYPIFVLVIVLVIVGYFGFYGFPKIIEATNISKENIPTLVQGLIGVCEFIKNHIFLSILSAGTSIWILIKLLKQKFVKVFFDKFLLQVPAVSNFVRYINLASFFAILDASYDAGFSVPAAIDLAKKSISNVEIKNDSERITELVTQGNPLSQALAFTSFVPETFVTIIASGEKSGQLGKMFNDITIEIDKKIDDAMDVLMQLFQPVLIVIIGIIVGIVVLLMLQMINTSIFSLF